MRQTICEVIREEGSPVKVILKDVFKEVLEMEGSLVKGVVKEVLEMESNSGLLRQTVQQVIAVEGGVGGTLRNIIREIVSEELQIQFRRS